MNAIRMLLTVLRVKPTQLTILATVLGVTLCGLAQGQEGPSAPANPRCEYRVNPLGIDIAAPRLSWEVSDTRRGAVQSAYEIVVTRKVDAPDAQDAEAWNTGKVVSDQSTHVTYAGQSLQPFSVYEWKVRTWDADDVASDFSEPATWETGPMSAQDWQARWISMPNEEIPVKETPLGSWVWHEKTTASNSESFLRKSFEIPADTQVLEAVFKAAVDNTFEFYVNGERAGDGGGWKTLFSRDLSEFLRPGKNTIAVKATNATGECGFMCGARIELADGKTIEVVSDTTWRARPSEEENWTAPDHDDSAWGRPVVIAKRGEAPWGPIEERRVTRSFQTRKGLSFDKPVKRARAYVSGLGQYELRVNGAKVGKDLLTPGWTQYFKHIQFQAYDVTDLLRTGENVVGAITGGGWWAEGMAGNWADGEQRFIAQIDIVFADGTKQTVVTDTTWKTNLSPILSDSFYNGVTYDATQEIPGWDAAGFDDSAWANAIDADKPLDLLLAQNSPTIQVTEELPAVTVNQPSDGVYVYDFGQNLVGRARLKVQGPKGARVTIRFAEVLKDDGNIYTANYRAARCTDVYVLKGDGEEVWSPPFTYRGFRYAELQGYPGTPGKDALVAEVFHSAAEPIGRFECSDKLINQIQKNILWGQRGNMHSVPTDCPQRDERLGWTGDAQAFAPTSCWNMDMTTFYEKWMRDIRDSAGEDGAIKDVNPTLWTDPAKPGWGDVVAVVPWVVYQFSGDPRVIEQNYDAVVGWVEYMRANAPNNLYKREGYGDWVAVVESPKEPIGAAYYYYSTKLLSQMAAVIGKNDDAAKYGKLAEDIATAFNEAYLDREKNTYPSGTQTAQILPLYFGITPADAREGIEQTLLGDIAGREYHLSTGFLGTAYLMPLLTQIGDDGHAVAYRLATQRTYPSWGYTVEKGATTIWERWNSDQIETVGAGMNSFNHFCFGAVGQWFYESLAGLNIDSSKPGFKHIIVRPRPAEGLTWAEAEHRSAYGPISCAWRVEEGHFALELSIPANTSATLYLPVPKEATVTEGGKPVDQSQGVRIVKHDEGELLLNVGAGKYTFESSSVNIVALPATQR